MTEAIAGNGGCLCGAVRFTADNTKPGVGACHCRMCRRWGGGPLMAVDCGADVAFEGGENIAVFNSSEWADRGFCKQCGSHLFYRLKKPVEYIMPVGLFDEQDAFVFKDQVFIDKKPAFYAFANETHDMTEAEVFAKYGAPP